MEGMYKMYLKMIVIFICIIAGVIFIYMVRDDEILAPIGVLTGLLVMIVTSIIHCFKQMRALYENYHLDIDAINFLFKIWFLSVITGIIGNLAMSVIIDIIRQ